MTEEPRFRTVLHVHDPAQVSATMADLQHSLKLAREAEADRALELAQALKEKAMVEAEVALLRSRSAADGVGGPDGQPPQAATDSAAAFEQLGGRITSILRLAEAEADQLKHMAVHEVQELRETAAKAAETARSESEQYAERAHERTDNEVARMVSAATATADAIVAQANDDAQTRRAEAERMVAAAHEQAEQTRRETQQELADAVNHRDAVHAHLAEINQLLAVLEDALADAGRVPEAEPTHG